MRAKLVTALLLTATIMMMATRPMPAHVHSTMTVADSDSITPTAISIDSITPTAIDSTVIGATDGTISEDTTTMDSLSLAIYHYNKAIDDSLRLDSINRAKPNGINSPVTFSANDSIVYYASTKDAYLFGESKVDYEDMKLTSERVHMNLDKSLVDAAGVVDSTEAKGLSGTPVFNMGNDSYESDTIFYNFKTKKGFIENVYTEQQDGYIRSEKSKRDDNGNLYLEHGTYTTCDEEHPDFYIALSRAKIRPGKDVVFGSAYLVVADVPLPLAIPYGFFPFTKSYSSGFIMPSYGDESSKGFYLNNFGYYFAINDKWDLKLLGEIYTKGSWGISAASNYKKRYRYNGKFFFSYQDSKTGDKGMPDFSEDESFKLQWNHSQDSKANPYGSLSASVNFSSSKYERNNLTSMYNPQTMTQSIRTSSVSYNTQFSSLNMTLNTSANVTQNMLDTTVAMQFPNISVTVSRFYPFKRKKAVGKERWYEKLSIGYNGSFLNSINTNESKFFHSNLIKDWKNGIQHDIPISGNFTLFNNLSINPRITFKDYMYTDKITRSWDEMRMVEVADTTYGFYNLYNWSFNVGFSTKLYGFWIPSRKIFGDKIDRIRHVFTPTVSFGYAPDFGASKYGIWDQYTKVDAQGKETVVNYSPFDNGIFGHPGRGKTGSVTFDVSNNLEMKIRSEKDSTGFKKISLIDELGFNLGYNMAAKERPWSDLSVRLRLKWWKRYTFSTNMQFATYAYELDENGRPYVGTHTEWGYGRFGRFQGMTQSVNFTLSPEKFKKWFGGGSDEDEDEDNEEDDEGIDTDIESNVDKEMVKGLYKAKKKGKAETDDDGYMAFNIPWSLTFSYSINMRENTSGKFNKKTMRYPYKFTHTLNFNGNIRISDGWNIHFMSGYDFNFKKLSMTTASLSRDLHCFSMSCSLVLAPYTSYNFTFRCNASTLTDALKYDKRSGQSNAVRWY